MVESSRKRLQVDLEVALSRSVPKAKNELSHSVPHGVSVFAVCPLMPCMCFQNCEDVSFICLCSVYLDVFS